MASVQLRQYYLQGLISSHGPQISIQDEVMMCLTHTQTHTRNTKNEQALNKLKIQHSLTVLNQNRNTATKNEIYCTLVTVLFIRNKALVDKNSILKNITTLSAINM